MFRCIVWTVVLSGGWLWSSAALALSDSAPAATTAAPAAATDDPASAGEHDPANAGEQPAAHPPGADPAAHSGGGGHAHVGEDVAAVTKDPSEFRTDLAIFTAVVFLVLFFGLKTLAWPKIESALQGREDGIRKAISDAEHARLQAETFMKEHKGRLEAVEEQVAGILAEARRDAERTRTDILKQAESETEALKNRALTEIGRAKDQALNEIFETMADQVAQATEHVVGHGLNSSDQDRLIRAALQQVTAGSKS